MGRTVRDVLFGRRLASNEDEEERIGPLAGVAILGLDALASAAYGPEALLTVLLPLGAGGLGHAVVITGVIVALLLLVAFSYRETIRAYPDGGGAYTVAKKNLGPNASLLAAACLALDYVLNVAVAISAGVGALVSAVPVLLPHTLPLALGVLAALTLVNLRGIRATGLVFTAPTYIFLGALFALVALGIGKAASAPAPHVVAHAPASAWLLLRAFANGCTAMTGIEAVSNGTPLFREPSVVGARRTLVAIVGCLVVLLAGIMFLARAYGVTATEPGQPGYESLLSQVTAAVVGRGAFYYVTLTSIVAVLAFSANTSFADFPRVCRLLAADRYLPEPFVHRGRRLTFSHGIVILAILAGALLVTFGGITDALIPLFAVGALSAFTMSQIGMVAHWRKEPGRGAKLVLSLAGAIATGATLLVVLVSKLTEGAWISLALVAAMMALFRSARAHYDLIARVTTTPAPPALVAPRSPLAIVPMRRWDAVSVKAMSFALGISEDVVAVQVLTGDRGVDDLTRQWPELARVDGGRPAPRLVVLRSEYRQLFAPLLDFVGRVEKEHPNRPIAVVVGELVEPRWYHHFLHGHTASLMKAMLLFRGSPQTVIVNLPWHLERWRPERKLVRRWRWPRLRRAYDGAP